jgi:uncharacterized membrane protein
MTGSHAGQIVDEYLQRLERELTDLSRNNRNEIIDEIRRHIAEESGGLADESDAALMNLLERLGEPADIAAAARGGEMDRTSVATTRRFGTLEVLGLILLVVAWPVGVILLWVSKIWTTRERLLGTLIPPGGYPGVLLMVSTFHWISAASEGGPAWVGVTVRAVLFTVSLVALIAPVGVTVFLATRLRAR